MRSPILLGLAAGAAGTVALNVATYLDMAIRGRGSSNVPADLAGKLTDAVGLELTPPPAADEQAQQTAQHRRSGIGALMGYVVGLGVGAAYGALRPRASGLPLPLAGIGVGLAAMAASDLPAITTGVTDPASWGVSGWLADIVPHLAYGLTTAIALDALKD